MIRFESLTLSHNNMIALKPVLLAWLEEAEAARRDPVSLWWRWRWWWCWWWWWLWLTWWKPMMMMMTRGGSCKRCFPFRFHSKKISQNKIHWLDTFSLCSLFILASFLPLDMFQLCGIRSVGFVLSTVPFLSYWSMSMSMFRLCSGYVPSYSVGSVYVPVALDAFS